MDDNSLSQFITSARGSGIKYARALSLMTITLRDIKTDNFIECIKLCVNDEQKEVAASSILSWAEAKVDGVSILCAVYAGESIVGFIIHSFEPKENHAYINCLVVAGRFPMQQRRTLIFNKVSVLSERQDTAEEISRRVLADPKHMKWGLLGDMTDGRLEWMGVACIHEPGSRQRLGMMGIL